MAVDGPEIARAGARRRDVLLAAMAMLLPAGQTMAQGIRLNDEIIADPHSGAALFGFDPLSYFVEGRALPGRPEVQAIHGGKVWYFQSEANRAAFLAGPALYIPAFGGHDPMGVAAGFAVAGHPETFAFADDKLLLFRGEDTRAQFLREPARLLQAERNWPLVRRDMVP